MFGPVLEAYFKIFYLQQNTIQSFQFFVFIGIINYKKIFFTIFNTILYWFFKPK